MVVRQLCRVQDQSMLLPSVTFMRICLLLEGSKFAPIWCLCSRHGLTHLFLYQPYSASMGAECPDSKNYTN